MEVRSYDEIFNDLKATFLSKQDKITDFNKASVIKAFFEAVATEEARKYIETDIAYTSNLNAIPASIFEFTKKSGSIATGEVIFSRSAARSYETTIASGTVVSGGGYTFTTTEQGKIAAGDVDSGTVAVVAKASGAAYNLAAGTITSIDSSVSSDVAAVRNDAKTSGGADEESDAEMLARFKTYINGLQGTSIYGLTSAVQSVEGVRSVNVVEHFASQASVYHATVYAEDGTGNLEESIKEAIEDVIEGDGTSVNPGKRAPGINIEVCAPGIVSVDIELKCYYYRADTAVIESEIEDAIKEYINALTIGEDVVLTSIIAELRKLTYIKDVEISALRNSDGSVASVNLSNLTIEDSQIARFNSCALELEEYS